MTVAQIIDEIGELDAGAQDEVIHFAVTLAASRRLSGRELHDLAAQLPGPAAAGRKCCARNWSVDSPTLNVSF